MRPKRVALILLALVQVALHGQAPPTDAFRQWARGHVHAVSPGDDDSASRDDEVLRMLSAPAHVLGFGEPFHGGHEPLSLRNRLIRNLVTRDGFSAIALETDLTSSKRLYDYVLGRGTEAENDLKSAFSYGFGELPENIQLIRWLRTYNASQPAPRHVHLYGVDLAGQFSPNAYRSVDAVLAFLNRADPRAAADLRHDYDDVLAGMRSNRYMALTGHQKDAISARIGDLTARLRRDRVPLTAATSRDDFEWALQQAVNAAQDDAFLRALPNDFDPDLLRRSPGTIAPSDRWEMVQDMRELAIADNVRWVGQRERDRGKVFFFAHNSHVQTAVFTLGAPGRPIAWPVPRWRSAGMYLRSALGSDFAAIGTYFGHGVGFDAKDAPAAPDAAGTDGLLASVATPRFAMNLHDLPPGPILEWFQAVRATRCCRSGSDLAMVSATEAFDGIVYLDEITPSAMTGPKRW